MPNGTSATYQPKGVAYLEVVLGGEPPTSMPRDLSSKDIRAMFAELNRAREERQQGLDITTGARPSTERLVLIFDEGTYALRRGDMGEDPECISDNHNARVLPTGVYELSSLVAEAQKMSKDLSSPLSTVPIVILPHKPVHYKLGDPAPSTIEGVVSLIPKMKVYRVATPDF